MHITAVIHTFQLLIAFYHTSTMPFLMTHFASSICTPALTYVVYCVHVALNTMCEYFFSAGPYFDFFFFFSPPMARPLQKIRFDIFDLLACA